MPARPPRFPPAPHSASASHPPPAVTRFACTGPTGWVDGKCSNVTQQPYDFAEIIARFAG